MAKTDCKVKLYWLKSKTDKKTFILELKHFDTIILTFNVTDNVVLGFDGWSATDQSLINSLMVYKLHSKYYMRHSRLNCEIYLEHDTQNKNYEPEDGEHIYTKDEMEMLRYSTISNSDLDHIRDYSYIWFENNFKSIMEKIYPSKFKIKNEEKKE